MEHEKTISSHRCNVFQNIGTSISAIKWIIDLSLVTKCDVWRGCHAVSRAQLTIPCQDGTNKQMSLLGQVRTNTRGISGQLPGARRRSWQIGDNRFIAESLIESDHGCYWLYNEQHRPWLYGNRSPLDHLGWISSCYIWIIHKTSLRRLSTSSDTHTSGGAIGCCKLDLLTADIGFKMKQDGLTEL